MNLKSTQNIEFKLDNSIKYLYKKEKKSDLELILKNIQYIKNLLDQREQDNLLALGLLNEIFIKLNKQ